MKKSVRKYDEMVSHDVIRDNYRTIMKNTKHRNKIVKFDIFFTVNIHNIYKALQEKRYKHGRYNIFLVHEPKYRIVMGENIHDKIVNHVLSNVYLKEAIYPKLIDENVATRVGKGTSAAIALCRKYFVRMNNKYKKFYVLKFDITKYFYNIDHEILKSLLREVFVDEEVLKILYETIDATDYGYINMEIDNNVRREIERLKRLNIQNLDDKIEELKRIPHYSPGKGLGIGSLTNQIYAVFYLNKLDHYIKENLGIREYIRFMDDGLIFCEDKDRLREILKIIDEKIRNEFKLELNNKTKIYTATEGFEFVGYRFRLKNGRMLIRVKNSTKNRMKRKFKILAKHDMEKYTRVKASYKGLVQYCTCKSLYNKYFKEDDLKKKNRKKPVKKSS